MAATDLKPPTKARQTYEGYISYGGIVLPFTKLECNQRTLYAEDGATQIGIEHAFTVSGLIAGSSRSDFQAKFTLARQQLQQPRQDFIVQSASARLYSFTSNGANINHPDPAESAYATLVEDWGPLPTDLRFTMFRAGMACNYSFTLTCVAKECTPASTVCAGILAITQSFSHSVDMNGLTTRTLTGKLTVKAVTPGVNGDNGIRKAADEFRNYVLPPLPDYYQRTHQEFHQSPDARELTYTIVDVEQVWTLPKPMTTGNATLHISITMSALVQGTLSGSFSAPATVSKAVILQAINDLMIANIPNLPNGTPNQTPMTQVFNLDFTDHIYENKIDFSIRFSAGTDGTSMLDAGQTWLKKFPDPPVNSDGLATWVNAYGGTGYNTSGIVAARHATYDACQGTSAGGYGDVPAGQESTDAGGSRPDPDAVSAGSTSNISGAHQHAPYLQYHEEISYELDNGIIFFQPTVAGHPPLAQQVRTPAVTLIQAGYCTRAAMSSVDRPVPPGPMLASNATLLTSFISPAAEEVVDQQWSRFTVHWRYVMRYNKEVVSIISGADPTHVSVYWPQSPIRPVRAWSDMLMGNSTELVSAIS